MQRTTDAALRPTRAAFVVWGLLAALSGCETPPPNTCEGVTAAPITAEDRRILGLASPYPADAMLSSRTDALVTSQRLRREAAWEVVARVFAPVPLAQPTGVDGATVPRFRTWYDRIDLQRAFRRAYEGQGREGRIARAHLSEASLDEAFAWNPSAVFDLAGWTEERFSAYALSLADEAAVAGTSGIVRIQMSPDATRHVADSYPEILRCVLEGSPPAFVDGPAEATQRMAREPVNLPTCELRTYGPYFVATGGSLAAQFVGEAGSGVGTFRVLEGETRPSATEVCVATLSGGATTATCDAEGPGAFYVEVESTGAAIRGMLDVSHSAPDVNFAACLNGVFPLASATVAAEWRRMDFDPLPTYDTSGPSLATHLAADDATWGPGDGTATPGPDEIYTLRLPSGGTFGLAGLHIRTRELDHWVNITLWWTPTPNVDFGADRSASVRALGAPWDHYAMCVAIEDVERDPDPRGGVSDPSLGDALEAAYEGLGGPSWCSNPYIDGAPGLVRSNCVGCHQHGFTGVRPGETVMDEARFPAHGRLFVRNNMPGDQFWGLDGGDDLAAMIRETVDYWDGADL